MGSDRIPVLKPEVALSLPNEPQPAVDDVSAKLYMDAKSGVVRINSDTKNSISGFIVGDGSQIVTSARNLLGTKEQFAFGPDGKSYKLELEKLDDLKDIAVLRIKNGGINGAHSLPLGDIDKVEQSDKLWSLSFPRNVESLSPYLSPGYARRLNTPLALLRSVDREGLKSLPDTLKTMTPLAQKEAESYLDRPVVDTKMHIELGSAGGPVLQADGKVIGLNILSNLKDARDGQTMVAPVTDVQSLLDGKGRFDFHYKNVGADWSEQFRSDLQNNQGKAFVDTALTGALTAAAFKTATAFPRLASATLGAYSLVNLSRDTNNFLRSTDSEDSWKYGLSAASDLGTIGGAALTLATKQRGIGLAVMGLSIAAHTATDFIRNHRVLDATTRIEGDPNLPPFNLDELLNKNSLLPKTENALPKDNPQPKK